MTMKMTMTMTMTVSMTFFFVFFLFGVSGLMTMTTTMTMTMTMTVTMTMTNDRDPYEIIDENDNDTLEPCKSENFPLSGTTRFICKFPPLRNHAVYDTGFAANWRFSLKSGPVALEPWKSVYFLLSGTTPPLVISSCRQLLRRCTC